MAENSLQQLCTLHGESLKKIAMKKKKKMYIPVRGREVEETARPVLIAPRGSQHSSQLPSILARARPELRWPETSSFPVSGCTPCLLGPYSSRLCSTGSMLQVSPSFHDGVQLLDSIDMHFEGAFFGMV